MTFRNLLTSTHALVVSQHISSRTHALIGPKGVNTAEGTKQRILGALIDIWKEFKVTKERQRFE